MAAQVCSRTQRDRTRLARFKAHHLPHQTFTDADDLDRAIHAAVITLNAERNISSVGQTENLCLAKIDIRQNLIARGKRVYLVVPEGDTKNGEPVDFELPAATIDVIAWYIREYRPYLLRAPTDALFPGEGCGPKSAEGLGAQIKATVFRFSGLRVNVHLFRHAGAKIFLDQRPGLYEVVRQVLRHRSIETTTSFYAGAETRSAGQHYASVINKLREDLSQSPEGPLPKASRLRGRNSSRASL